MKDVADAFWRALAYTLHPATVLATVLPLLVAAAGVLLAGWFGWEPAVDAVRVGLDDWALSAAALQWLDRLGAGGLRAVLAPLVVVAVATPPTAVLCLVLVAGLATPSLVKRVLQRRFPALERRGRDGLGGRLGRSLGLGVLALLALAATLPLWLVPPLALALPALVWGWLAARVFGHAVLAGHATADERRLVLRQARAALWFVGVASGALATVPSLLWLLAGAAGLVFAPLLMLAAVWLYTLVFALAALWVAHLTLARLHALRAAALSSRP